MIQPDTLHTAAGRFMSNSDFATFGVEHVAYVKPVTVDGQPLFGIYSADGQQLAFVEGRDLADATVRQNDLEPLSVH